MQLPSCLYANWVGLRFFSITTLTWVWYTTFLNVPCDHGSDVDASVVRILVGEHRFDLW